MEGGAVTTDDDDLAEAMRLMRNFGFGGYDNVIHPGTNGKMVEVCAAMGLSNLDSLDDVFASNRRNHLAYKEALAGISGLSVLDYDPQERNSYHYVVIELAKGGAALHRSKGISVQCAAFCTLQTCALRLTPCP